MTDFYVKSGSSTARANSTVVSTLGQRLSIARADAQTNFAVMRRYIYEVTTIGTTGSSVPVYPTTPGSTVVDGTVVLTCRECDSWTNASPYVDYIQTRTANGDIVYVSNNHNETAGNAFNFALTASSSAPFRLVCVDDGATPPTTGATTGAITTTSNNSITYTNSGYTYGIKFNIGTGSSASNFSLANNASDREVFEKCQFIFLNTSTSSKLFMGSTGSSAAASEVTLKNCDLKFAANGQGISMSRGRLRWFGGSLLSGSTSQTGSFIVPNGAVNGGFHCDILIDSFDFSNLGSSGNLVGISSNTTPMYAKFRNCKLPASWTGVLVTGSSETIYRVEMHNCDSGATNYRLWVEDYMGSIKTETTLVKTGGASDGTTPFSWKMATSANASYPTLTLESIELPVERNTTTGSSVTVTVDILCDTATNLKNDEVWIEIEYPSSSGSPITSIISSAKASVVATAADLTSSSATWTTTGMTNPNKQKMAVTFTPQAVGFLQGRVFVAKTSTTIYVDAVMQVT